jgi:hypothetical protein
MLRVADFKEDVEITALLVFFLRKCEDCSETICSPDSISKTELDAVWKLVSDLCMARDLKLFRPLAKSEKEIEKIMGNIDAYKQELYKKAAEKHKPTCANNTVSCEKCRIDMKLGEMKSHLLIECPKTTHKCVCGKEVTSGKIGDHFFECESSTVVAWQTILLKKSVPEFCSIDYDKEKKKLIFKVMGEEVKQLVEDWRKNPKSSKWTVWSDTKKKKKKKKHSSGSEDCEDSGGENYYVPRQFSGEY